MFSLSMTRGLPSMTFCATQELHGKGQWKDQRPWVSSGRTDFRGTLRSPRLIAYPPAPGRPMFCVPCAQIKRLVTGPTVTAWDCIIVWRGPGPCRQLRRTQMGGWHRGQDQGTPRTSRA